MAKQCSKLAKKDTDTIAVSLMETLNAICLTYSSDDLLLK